jgi:hypothetical protein
MATDDLKGYDYNFVDPIPDSLICLICTGAARSAQQTVCCGKIFCEACLLEWKSYQLDATCPQCRKEIDSFPDLRGNFKIAIIILLTSSLRTLSVTTANLKSFHNVLYVLR